MPHHVPLIATIAVGLAAAFVLGFVATRLKLPPLIGYLLAGIAVGPFTPGFIADTSLAGQLAEIGVILLMFGVGMHFSLSDLMAVRRIALPGAIVQIAVATALGALLAHWWGWSLASGLVFGLALSVASTVVMLKALEQRGNLDSMDGHIAVGWLVVEDLAMVAALVILPVVAQSLGGDAAGKIDFSDLALSLALTFGKIVIFFVVVHFVGVRVFPWIFARVAHTGSRELVTLFVIGVALGIAYGSAVGFDVSFGGDAVRPLDPDRTAAAGTGGAGHHRRGQILRGLSDRAYIPLSGQHRADGLGEPCADRRIFVHSCRARCDAGHPAAGGSNAHPCGRLTVDYA